MKMRFKCRREIARSCVVMNFVLSKISIQKYLPDQNRKPVLETVNAVISARHQIKKINTSRMSINKAKQLTREDTSGEFMTTNLLY